MGIGLLRVEATTGDRAYPVADADVTIKQRSVPYLKRTRTGEDGKTDDYPMAAPPKCHTLNPNYDGNPPYYTYDVDIRKEGYVTKHICDVEIVDTQTTILPVNMIPLINEPNPKRDMAVNIEPVSLLLSVPYMKGEPLLPPYARANEEVVIPDFITVHLGRPENASARNIKVNFADYIKNVTSSEIYPTWPEESLRANIYAIISFALNRVYTEWYRSKGYNFDITNSTSFDQAYREDGPIFENIGVIVDEIFNVYAHRFAFRNPYFTQFCNGTTVTCPGMSQWGTVTYANQGKTALEILRRYYPRDLQLTASDNIAGITESYPGEPLTLGSTGESVRRVQNDLNRIRINYPLIPVIPNPNGVYEPETQNSVITFQKIFDLKADGVVNRATWNKINSIYNAVTRLAELNGEGIRYTIGTTPPNVILTNGSRGEAVLEFQHIMNMIAVFYSSVPPVIMDGVFGTPDKEAVIEFQKTFGLPQSGTVNASTWEKLYGVYRGIRANVLVNPPSAEI